MGQLYQSKWDFSWQVNLTNHHNFWTNCDVFLRLNKMLTSHGRSTIGPDWKSETESDRPTSPGNVKEMHCLHIKKVKVSHGTWEIGDKSDLKIWLSLKQPFGHNTTHIGNGRTNWKLWLWFEGCKCKEPEENDQQCHQVHKMQPMWLCVLTGRQFEKTFENA